jgi:two-component system sensor histidine kinase ChvG
VRIVVEDQGPGIPDANLADVFERFYSERPGQAFGNHSGLGLAISKQIVEAHSGRIWAENIRSEGAGRGSAPEGARFVVELPVLGKQ